MLVDVLTLVLVLLLIAVFPAWPYSRDWGYAPSGGFGILIVIVLVLLLFHVV